MTARIRFPGLPFRRFRVFLSYARAQRPLAERLARTLESEGCDVFFDGDDLAPGELFNVRIREAIARCDLFVFLISPQSIQPDAYARAELTLAEKRWPTPRSRRVIGVMVEPVDMGAVPEWLRVTSILRPEGDVVAITSHAVAGARSHKRRRRFAVSAGSTMLVLAGIYAAVSGLGRSPSRDELAAFHLAQAETYLDTENWNLRAQKWAGENPAVLDKGWLKGEGITHRPVIDSAPSPKAATSVVFGHTEGKDFESTIRTLGNTAEFPSGSVHVVIDRDGKAVQIAPFDWNEGPVGIYMVNMGEGKRTRDDFPGEVRPESIVAAPDPRTGRPMYWESYPEPQLFRAIQVAWHFHKTERLGPKSEVNPGPAFPLPLIRLLLVEGEELEVALNHFREAARLDPGNEAARAGPAQVGTAYLLAAGNSLPENPAFAARQLDRADSLLPGDPRVDSLRALLAARQRQP